MKFKVGDKVRVKEDLNLYNDAVSEMLKYKGDIATIMKVFESNNCYKINIDNFGWLWTDEMFEPVEEDEDIVEENTIEYKGKKYDVYKEIDCDNNKFNKVLQLKEVKEEILDEEEKEYLNNVIKPFRNRIIGIKKEECCMSDLDVESEMIFIIDKKQGHSLLPFRKNSMYVGMKLNEPYTLEQLGLEE